MRKFVFRLDSALRWRSTQLQLERAKLQTFLAEEQRLQQSLQALGEERRQAAACLAESQLQALDLRSLSSYLVGAEAKASILQEQIRKRSVLIQQQRDRVILAERNLRLLEKLREKRHAEWKHELDREIESAAEEAWIAANFGSPTPTV
jgi:hypothetical protein